MDRPRFDKQLDSAFGCRQFQQRVHPGEHGLVLGFSQPLVSNSSLAASFPHPLKGVLFQAGKFLHHRIRSPDNDRAVFAGGVGRLIGINGVLQPFAGQEAVQRHDFGRIEVSCLDAAPLGDRMLRLPDGLDIFLALAESVFPAPLLSAP